MIDFQSMVCQIEKPFAVNYFHSVKINPVGVMLFAVFEQRA